MGKRKESFLGTEVAVEGPLRDLLRGFEERVESQGEELERLRGELERERAQAREYREGWHATQALIGRALGLPNGHWPGDREVEDALKVIVAGLDQASDTVTEIDRQRNEAQEKLAGATKALQVMALRACDAHAAVFRAMKATPEEASAACQDDGYLHEAVHACLLPQAADGIEIPDLALEKEVQAQIDRRGERALRAEQALEEARPAEAKLYPRGEKRPGRGSRKVGLSWPRKPKNMFFRSSTRGRVGGTSTATWTRAGFGSPLQPLSSAMKLRELWPLQAA